MSKYNCRKRTSRCLSFADSTTEKWKWESRSHFCRAFGFGHSMEHPYLPALVMIISVPISWNLFQRSAHCNSTWISSMVDMAAGTGPAAPDARSAWVPKEQEVRSVSTSESDPVLCSESEKGTIKTEVRSCPVAPIPDFKRRGSGRHGGFGGGVSKRRLESGKLQSTELGEFYYLFYGLFLWFMTSFQVSCSNVTSGILVSFSHSWRKLVCNR